MNVAKHYFKTSNPVTSTPYYNLTLLNGVSSSARLLYIELRRLSGLNGYTSKSIRELSYFIGKSARQVSRLVHELESNRLIEIWQHEGFENEYVIPDVYFRHTHDKCVRTFKSKINTKLTVSRQKPNGISLGQIPKPIEPEPVAITAPAPEPEHHETELPMVESGHKSIHIKPKNPVNFQLVKDILALTNDHKSVRFWIKFVVRAPENIVQLAIHSLKSALSSETVYHAGRYLVGIIKRIFPEMFDSGHKVPLRQSEQCPDASYYPRIVVSEPDIERNEQLNMTNIQAIRALLAKREQLCQA